jgi:hypothetical protein
MRPLAGLSPDRRALDCRPLSGMALSQRRMRCLVRHVHWVLAGSVPDSSDRARTPRGGWASTRCERPASFHPNSQFAYSTYGPMTVDEVKECDDLLLRTRFCFIVPVAGSDPLLAISSRSRCLALERIGGATPAYWKGRRRCGRPCGRANQDECQISEPGGRCRPGPPTAAVSMVRMAWAPARLSSRRQGRQGSDTGRECHGMSQEVTLVQKCVRVTHRWRCDGGRQRLESSDFG